MKKLEETLKKIEKANPSDYRINKLKSFGIFIKTYNMSHLLVTRYSVKEDFGVEKGMKKLDDLEAKVKDITSKISKIEHEKKEEGKKEIEELKKKLGEQKDDYKGMLNEVKASVGTEMFNRYMLGFVRGNNSAENERQEHTEFLFKKLKF